MAQRLPTTARPSASPFQTFADTALLRTRSRSSLDVVGHGRRPLPARAHAARRQVLAGGRVPGGATRESNRAFTLPLRRRGTAPSTTDGGECWTSMALQPLMIPTTQRRLLLATAWSMPPPPPLGSPLPGLAAAAAWRTTACSAASPAPAARRRGLRGDFAAAGELRDAPWRAASSSATYRGGARRAPLCAMVGRPELRRAPWRSLSPSTEATIGELPGSARLHLEPAIGGPGGGAPRQALIPPCVPAEVELAERGRERAEGGRDAAGKAVAEERGGRRRSSLSRRSKQGGGARAGRLGRARLDPPPPCRVPADEGGERRKARRRGGATPRSSGVAAKDGDRW
ncbi:hypothetical protein PVAP13_1KG014293 [Panicum virgatum]|uniref:Uncharacterized protein n=1 Tax=Panicum virgatum TaxID=38727 RepID=A0A8T0X1C5_PANVG|nr:hypothetical protein PVAP13_1KG014293 [Panicum virgatum]